MLNQVVIVGRISTIPTIKELESGRKILNITIAVTRSYKNAEGIYETDFVDCILWNGVAENTVEYCKKGDLFGIKGRLEVRNNKLQVIGEKITFLSSKKENE